MWDDVSRALLAAVDLATRAMLMGVIASGVVILFGLMFL